MPYAILSRTAILLLKIIFYHLGGFMVNGRLLIQGFFLEG